MLVENKEAITPEIETKLIKFLHEYNQVCTKEKAIHLDKNFELKEPKFQIGTETEESYHKSQLKDSIINKSNSKNNSEVKETKGINTSEMNKIFQFRRKLNISKKGKTGELNKNAMMSSQVSNRDPKNGVLGFLGKIKNESQVTVGPNNEDTCEESCGKTSKEPTPVKHKGIKKIPLSELLKSQKKNNLGRKRKSQTNLDESIRKYKLK